MPLCRLMTYTHGWKITKRKYFLDARINNSKSVFIDDIALI